MSSHITTRLKMFILGLLLFTAAIPDATYAQQKKKTTTATSAQKKTTTAAKKTSASKGTSASAKKSTSTTAKKATTSSAKESTPSRANYEKQQRELMKQIQETEKMISDNDHSVASQQRDIKLREEEIGKRRALLVSMNNEIKSLADEEEDLHRTIEQLTRNYKGKQEKYVAAVRHLYKWRGGYDAMLFVLSADNLVESMRRVRYLRQYSLWRERQAIALCEERDKTQAAREALHRTRSERERLAANVNSERAALSRKQEQQELALAGLKKRGKELQAELERDRKKQAEIQKKIQQMIEEERRKAEEARRKAEEARKKAEAEAARKAAAAAQNKTTASSTTSKPASSSSSGNKTTSSTTTYKVDDSYTRLTGSFRQNKGKMPYPLDANFAFLSHYKEKNDGNVSITLSTSIGAHACAIFEGTVLRCSRSSEDWTVIVSHGDYMSVYSNLSSVAVREGAKVKMRDVIGTVKADVDGRRAELMFWIYGKSDAENPEAWLRR